MLSKQNEEENRVVLLMTRHSISFPGNNELARMISQLSKKNPKLTLGEKRSNIDNELTFGRDKLILFVLFPKQNKIILPVDT